MAIYGNMVVPSKAAGGALPTDNSDRNVYVPGTEVSARYSDAGGVLAAQGQQKAAEGLGNLGKGLGALAGMGMALYTRQRRVEHAEAMEAVSRLQTEYIEKQREWSQIKGANAIGMEELKSRWWDEAMPRYTDGLSDYGKRYFNLNADRIGAQADTFIQNHQEREINQYEGQQLKLAMDAEGNMIAANPFDPAAAAASQGRIRGLIHQEAVRKGWTPEMEEQAFLAASGKAWGNAIAVRISMGDLEGANRLMVQYGASVSPEDQAKLRQAWSAGKMGLLAAYAGAGKVDAIRRELDGNGAQSLDARLEVGAGATLGEKYTWGKNDCSGHTCQIWQAALGDSPAKVAIFGRDGAHTTAAEIMRNAYNYTHKLYQGAEINPASVKGGWLLATTGQGHAVREGRWNNIGHIVTTYQKGDGSIWVSEASSTSGQVTTVPLRDWLASQKRPLLGVDLSSLQPGQVGALPGGYQGAAGAPYTGGKVHDISAPIVGQIVSEAQSQGVNPAQVLAVCQIESSGNMNNRTGNYHGLFQLSEEDTREFGKPGDNRHDQATNIRVGIAQWKRCMQEMGNDEKRACVAYNMGIGAAKKWVQAGADVSKLPKETQAYLKKYERYMAGIPANIGNGAPAGAPSPQATPAQAANLTGNAKALYDQATQGVSRGDMTRQQALEYLQERVESAKAKASSQDAAVRKMAEGDYKSAQEALATFQQGQSQQAPAPAQATQGAQARPQGSQGFGPGFGLTPPEIQKAQNEYVPAATANGIVDAARAEGGSMAQTRAKAFAALEAMPAGERDKIRPIVERRLADLEQNQLAQDGVLYEETLKTLSGMNPRDRETFIAQMSASGKASPELIKKVTTWNSGVKAVEKESGERWASDMRGRMDEYYANMKTHSDALEKEVSVKKMKGEITDETAQKLMEWSRTGGSRKNFTQGTLKELYNEGKPKAEWKDPPEDLVQRLWAQMRNAGDKPVGKDEIREMMRKEMLPTTTPYPGMMPFKKTEEVPYHQAMSEGRTIMGLTPDPEEIPRLKREMEELARRRPNEFKLKPDNPEDVKAYYAGKRGGKW